MFCDEAQIGVVADNISHGNFSNLVNPFFYNHLSTYTLGNLPVLAAAPVVRLFGLGESALRLSSVVYAVGSLVIVYAILSILKQKYKLVTTLVLAFTPVFFHISRINFGHTPSLLLVLLAYFIYIKASHTSSNTLKKIWYLVAGLLFSVSAYGYGSFALTTPLYVVAMIIAEVLYNRLSFKKYWGILLVIIGICIGYLPVFHQAATNPKYLQRIKEKNADKSSFFSLDKTISIVKNYPKYYMSFYLSRAKLACREPLSPAIQSPAAVNILLLR